MQPKENVIDCYNKTADNYAGKFMDELSGKHLDLILLNAFAEENKDNGACIDLGCGPGQTTKYLFDKGLTNITGTDISPGMIETAKKYNPHIHFETADMLSLHYADEAFSSAIAFYSIVHFTYEQVGIAFTQIAGILKPGAQFLFCFHTGEQTVHMNQFLEHEVNIDFYFFETKKITALLTQNGFDLIDAIERQPYAGAEHPSTRAYIWAKKT